MDRLMRLDMRTEPNIMKRRLLLVDSVSSYRFITQKKSRELSKKIMSLSSIHGQNKLKSWLFKFAGEISLISPVKAREEYLVKARKVIDNSSSDR